MTWDERVYVVNRGSWTWNKKVYVVNGSGNEVNEV
jgi:hypothetical protein